MLRQCLHHGMKELFKEILTAEKSQMCQTVCRPSSPAALIKFTPQMSSWLLSTSRTNTRGLSCGQQHGPPHWRRASQQTANVEVKAGGPTVNIKKHLTFSHTPIGHALVKHLGTFWFVSPSLFATWCILQPQATSSFRLASEQIHQQLLLCCSCWRLLSFQSRTVYQDPSFDFCLESATPYTGVFILSRPGKQHGEDGTSHCIETNKAHTIWQRRQLL